MRTALLLGLCLCLASGCARYEFDLVEPAELAVHIGTSQATQGVVKRAPLTYVMRAVEGRLVIHVENDSDAPIELLGDRSYVVDPGEQSHPLPSLSIAPDSYIKLILPPMRPYARANPSVGFGIGIGVSRSHDRRGYSTGVGTGVSYGAGDPIYLASGPGELYWDWEGQTRVRARLTYRREEETFVHEFVFQRVKAK